MRAVVQRVREARVSVAGETIATMGEGLLALVGVATGDTREGATALAEKLVGLRVFEDESGRMNRSLLETGGTLGVVSQFTLLADARRGRRPSFVRAAAAAEAEPLVTEIVNRVRARGVPVVAGQFGARMELALVNVGPVTVMLDTEGLF